jgi:hypothetical protein
MLQAQLQSVHMKSFWGRLVTCQQQPQSLQDALLPALQVRSAPCTGPVAKDSFLDWLA